jgi:Bacteriophage baseplate protein W
MSTYSGRGWAFPPKLSDRDRMSMAQDDADIRQAIYIIINTHPGERVMRPDFGCEIHSLIFSPANDQTAVLAERYVKEALGRWEPRITVDAVRVTPGGTENGELFIEVVYEIKATHDRRSMVYPYYLLPG